MLKNLDSLIFDMDGTLWDNVNSYVKVWNHGFEQLGFDKRVDRKELIGLMGMEAQQLLDAVLPDASMEEQDQLFNIVVDAYDKMIPNIQPEVFPGVIEGLEKLSKKYKLFLLSNCEEGGLVNFMEHTQTRHLITDYREHGQNLQPKNVNLRLLMEKHKLQSTAYVGDTDGDAYQTELAGIPFVFVDYGFGETDNYAIKFSSFKDLTDYFLNE